MTDFETKLAAEAAQAAKINADNQAASGVIREERATRTTARKASARRRHGGKGIK